MTNAIDTWMDERRIVLWESKPHRFLPIVVDETPLTPCTNPLGALIQAQAIATVFWLSAYDLFIVEHRSTGMRVRDIADRLGITKGQVTYRLKRVQAKVEHRMRRSGYEPADIMTDDASQWEMTLAGMDS